MIPIRFRTGNGIRYERESQPLRIGISRGRDLPGKNHPEAPYRFGRFEPMD